MKARVIKTILERYPEFGNVTAVERKIRLAFNRGYVAAFDAAGIKVSSSAAMALYALWKGKAYAEAWMLLGRLMGLENHPLDNDEG